MSERLATTPSAPRETVPEQTPAAESSASTVSTPATSPRSAASSTHGGEQEGTSTTSASTPVVAAPSTSTSAGTPQSTSTPGVKPKEGTGQPEGPAAGSADQSQAESVSTERLLARHRCAFTFVHRVCELPAVKALLQTTTTAYDTVKNSSAVTKYTFGAAELGVKLVAGPCALAAVPLCIVMAVPICVADFGLNLTLDVAETVAPCITYDSEQAKKAAARAGVKIVNLPESAVAAVVALMNTYPGRAVVKVLKTTKTVAGKTVDLCVCFPKSGESDVVDTVYSFIQLPYTCAQHIFDAAEGARVAVRDRLIELS